MSVASSCLGQNRSSPAKPYLSDHILHAVEQRHLSVFLAQYHLEREECIEDEGCDSGGGEQGHSEQGKTLKPTHSLSEKQSAAANFRCMCTSELLLGAISTRQVEI